MVRTRDISKEKTKEVILDSSVWIAYLNPADSQHKKGELLLQSLEGNNFVVPEYVLAEVVSVLKNKKAGDVASTFFNAVLENDGAHILNTGEWLPLFAHEFRVYEETNLSFVDCALVALSHEYTICTFDTELAKILKKQKGI